MKLQKYLARIILDVKYDHNMSQTCIEIQVIKLEALFFSGINRCVFLT